MNDVSHELGALRFVVDSPLSSKVAMFNNHAQQHKQSQMLNPFSEVNGRASPKPTFSKDEYGKPLAGSLTEMRGQRANMHVLKEMLELCQIISSEGYPVKDEPEMRVIPFGELFNIYNYISDKVVGILLRARKHKLVEFEGEMLYQRRDDDVPIFLLRPVAEIREELELKIDDIKRAASPAPAATSVLMDRQQTGQLSVPGSRRNSRSRSTSPNSSKVKHNSSKAPSKENSPQPEVIVEVSAAAEAETKSEITPPSQATTQQSPQKLEDDKSVSAPIPMSPIAVETSTTTATSEGIKSNQDPAPTVVAPTNLPSNANDSSEVPKQIPETKNDENNNTKQSTESAKGEEELKQSEDAANVIEQIPDSSEDLPTIVIEASAVYVRTANTGAANSSEINSNMDTAAPQTNTN